jgi:hypothetical protein
MEFPWVYSYNQAHSRRLAAGTFTVLYIWGNAFDCYVSYCLPIDDQNGYIVGVVDYLF